MNDSPQPQPKEKAPAHLGYLLTAYLFKSLSAPGVREVETHLKRCAQCRAELQTLRHTLGLIEQSFDSDDKTYVFEERRRARVLEAARQPRPVLQMPVWSKFALASVAAVLMCGVLLFTTLSRSKMAANETTAAASAKAFAEAEETYHRTDYTGNGNLKYAPPPASAPPPPNPSIVKPNGRETAQSQAEIQTLKVDRNTQRDNIVTTTPAPASPPPIMTTESETSSKDVALAAKDDTIRSQESLIAQEKADNDKLHEENQELAQSKAGYTFANPQVNTVTPAPAPGEPSVADKVLDRRYGPKKTPRADDGEVPLPGFTNGPTEDSGRVLAEKKKKGKEKESPSVRNGELENQTKLADPKGTVLFSNDQKSNMAERHKLAEQQKDNQMPYVPDPTEPNKPPPPAATPAKDSDLISGGMIVMKDVDEKRSSDMQVPADLLAKAQLGDHYETINPDQPDTHSALGTADARTFDSVEGKEAPGGGGAGDLSVDDVIGVGGQPSKGFGGGDGSGSFNNRSGGGRKLMAKRHGGKVDADKQTKDELEMVGVADDTPSIPGDKNAPGRQNGQSGQVALDAKKSKGLLTEDIDEKDKLTTSVAKKVDNELASKVDRNTQRDNALNDDMEVSQSSLSKDVADGPTLAEKYTNAGKEQGLPVENAVPLGVHQGFYPQNKSESEENKKLLSKNFTLSEIEIFNRSQFAALQQPLSTEKEKNDPNYVPRYYSSSETGTKLFSEETKKEHEDKFGKFGRSKVASLGNFEMQSSLSATSADATEHLLRGYHYFKSQNPSLSFRDYASRPSPVPASALTDDGLDEDDYIERYGTRPFVDCARDHFSTFGLDVDTASYALARSRLRQGQLPEPDAVRVEEFLNYFKQPYSVCGEDAFGVFAEGAPSAFSNVDILKIGIKSRDPRPDERKPAMLTFCVDTSGSMTRDDRLELCRKALTDLVMTLNPEDTVSIVGFSEQAELILPRTQARQKQRILDAIAGLNSHGSTNVEAGLNMAYRMADESFSADAVNRVILCSDGVANIGAKGPDEMLKLVKIFSSRGIELSAVGFGMGQYNDKMMVRLADNGNGSCHFVDSLAEARKVFSEQLPPHLNVLARDAKAQVDFNPAVVERYRLLGYEKRKIADKDFRNDAIDSGDVAHSTLITVIYELTRKPAAHGDFGKIYLRWKDAGYRHLPVVERNYPLSEGVMASDVQKSSPQFRFLLCVARFAELLRDSPWVRDSSYASVLDELHRLPPDFQARADCREILELVQLAQRLSVEKWSKELGK